MTGRFNPSFVALLLALLAAPVPAASAASTPPPLAVDRARPPLEVTDLPGVERKIYLDGRVYIAGQPSAEALAELKRRGVTAVVNLRTAEEMADREQVPYDEAALAAELGLEYVHLPIGGADHPFRPEVLDRLADVLRRHPGPVLLHCTVGYRASWAWTGFLARELGFSLDDAVARGETMAISKHPLSLLLGRPTRLLLADPPRPAAPARAPVEIAPGVVLLAGAFVPGVQPDGNSVIFTAPDGLVVVDSGRHVEHTQAIVDFARAAGRPIAAIVNTHWHLDHLGGNALLRREFPALRVFASDAFAAARTGFLADYRRHLAGVVDQAADPATVADERAELALLDAAPALAPDEVVPSSGARRLAGRELRLELETHAVTAGDLWIFDPESRLLVAGDLVTLPVPFLDTACPERWRAALDHVAAIDFARLVPGHGAPMARADFERYRTAFGRLLDCAASSRGNQSCADGWLADVGALVPAAEHAFTRQLLDYYLDSALRADPARRAKLCAG